MDRLNILNKFLMVTVFALFVVNQTVLSRIQQNIYDALPELRIKNEVARQGTGEHARVTVLLRDERKVEGYISRAGDDGFSVVDPRTGKDWELSYRIVKDVLESETSGEGPVAGGLRKTADVLASISGSVR